MSNSKFRTEWLSPRFTQHYSRADLKSGDPGMNLNLQSGWRHSPPRHLPHAAVRLALLFAIGLCPIKGAEAHHSFGAFDQSKQAIVSGTVTVWQWTNPHVRITVTIGGHGKGDDWALEGWAPSIWRQQGWVRTSIKVGDKVTFYFHPNRDGTHGGSVINVTGIDGQSLKYEQGGK